MALIQNAPFAVIMLFLSGGVICCILKPRAAALYCVFLNVVSAVLMAGLLAYTMRSGAPYVYSMGHIGAPWGNELRAGVLEALLGLAFSVVMLLSVLGGFRHIFEDTEPKKVNIYFALLSLLMSTLMALVFTNDIFTAYVFIEINTLASCALVMTRYRSGKTLAATAQYLIMSLLGSGLFLIGVTLLYDITGHLLMEDIAREVTALAAAGMYGLPLTVVIALFAVSLALKSALFPFHKWLPDAHGSATATSSAVLSGLVLKAYIILLIKIFYRVVGSGVPAVAAAKDILFVLGALAMVFGSLCALREPDMKRMLAYSSVAQVGYIFLGIGLGTALGMAAACIQILAHAFTKPMLFCSAAGLMDVSGGSRRLREMKGAGLRAPLSGAVFVLGALSMIGIPLTAGFVNKLNLMIAVFDAADWKLIAGTIVVIISTVLNALYYLPAVGALFSGRGDGVSPVRCGKKHVEYIIAMAAFTALHLFFGIFSDHFVSAVKLGLSMF